MKALTECPFCAYVVLRHVRAGRVYWFCQHCREAVPEQPDAAPTRPSLPLVTNDPTPMFDR